MRCYIDISAFLAVLDADDKNYQQAKQIWIKLINEDTILFCSNYVLIEAIALIQHRFEIKALRAFYEDIIPLLTIVWIDETSHNEAIASLITAARKNFSLVDCVSFNIMRKLALKTAFAFDKHFKEQGFECLP